MSSSSEIALFFGRFHPVLVHLPIGLIVLLFFLELLARSRRFRSANASAGLLLSMAVPLAFITAGLGWVLSKEGDYNQPTLNWHMWTGFATAALSLLAAVLYRLQLRQAYRASLFFAFATLVVASHFGGSLTHGSDYLVHYAPGPLRRLVIHSQTLNHPSTLNPQPSTSLYASLVRQVLDNKCVACHGPDKSKGRLRLDSFEAIKKGGEAGPALVAGNAEKSELIRRLLLPLEHDDHMPPDGKPQPSVDEIALLQWWINSGADPNRTAAELNPPASVAAFIRGRVGSSLPAAAASAATELTPKPRAEVLQLAGTLERELGVPVTTLSETDPWLECSAGAAGTRFGDEQLAKLQPVAPNLRWLDLAGTGVTDTGMKHLKEMANLTRLHLERTTITDAGLAWLTNAANLEYLNLYGTSISDEGLDLLKTLPRLTHLYLWQTRVTPAAAQAFAEARTDKAQLERWQKEIEQLQANIRSRQIFVQLGAPVGSTNETTDASPVNTVCPVSGKPLVAGKSVLYERQLVGFCCDDCKQKFEKDPSPYLNALKPAPAAR